MPQIHIFKSGLHTDMLGRNFNISAADIAAMANAYDPGKHESPVVIGHPYTDAPAWGWIKSLRAEGDNLIAEAHQLDPQFCELVNDHRYKKVSPAFYSPDTPGNPLPGQYYLKHVGFLGAVPPAVKGLREIQFAAGDDDILAFADWSLPPAATESATTEQPIVDLAVPVTPVTPTTPAPPTEEIAVDTEIKPAPPAEETPADKDAKATATATAETAKPATESDTATALASENAALKKQLSELRAAQARAETDKRHAASLAFAEQLIDQAKLAPAGKNILVAVLDALSGSEEALMYAEGDSSQPLAVAFKNLLSASTPVLQFAEVASHDAAAPLAAADPVFAEADPARVALHNKALALVKSENITYEAAVKRLI